MRPRQIYEIARFTLYEAVSRRLILAGVVISLGYIALFTIGYLFVYDRSLEVTQSPRERANLGVAYASLALFGVYVVNYLTSFLALFLSVGAVSSEVDSGTLHALLARPLARSEFIVGRWVGYTVLISAYIAAMTGAIVLIAYVISGYEVPDPGRALLLMLLEAMFLLTLSLFGSTLLPTLANGVIVFTLLGLAWLGGIIEFVGRVLNFEATRGAGDGLINLGTVVSLIVPSDALWRGASYFLAPPILLAAIGGAGPGTPFFASAPPSAALIVWSVVYVAVLLGAAIAAFARRDL